MTAIIIRNVGDKHLKYADISQLQYEVIVKNTNGQTVPYTDSWARDKDAPHPAVFRAVLEALEPHQDSLPANGWVSVTNRYKMDALGTYVITAKRHVVLDEPSAPQGEKPEPLSFELVSNPVTITVVPPKPKQ
ncbi:MAG: hypothetical protein ACLPT4_05675 [Verrucomicrobiia bacterium]